MSKTNPDVHIICGKCGHANDWSYEIKKDIDDDSGKKVAVVYLICGNCSTLTGLDELIKNKIDEISPSLDINPPDLDSDDWIKITPETKPPTNYHQCWLYDDRFGEDAIPTMGFYSTVRRSWFIEIKDNVQEKVFPTHYIEIVPPKPPKKEN